MEKKKVSAAISQVKQAAFRDVVQCPICGYQSNGRILRGNFSGQRDTRVNAVVRHINKTHSEA